MESILEDKRSLHEERDRIELAIVNEMLTKKSGHKDKLDSEHRQKVLLDKYMHCSKRLSDLYEQHLQKNQEDKASSGARNTAAAFNEFYANLRKIMDFYANSPNEQVVSLPDEDVEEIQKVTFTDEESYGRFLDLNKCYCAYLQVFKNQESKPSYLTFLENFDRFTELDPKHKLCPAYKTYLEEMLSYFRDYSRRARPLFDYETMEKTVHQKFVDQWNEKKEQQNPQIDLEAYKSIDELLELGPECLKKELQNRGLKCGGTAHERAERLWSIRGVPPDNIDKTLMAKPAVGKKSTIDPFYIASIEAKLSSYAEHFNDYRIVTIENVQRKQARTEEERNESDEDFSDVEEEDDNNDIVYNPKNLPLGWDGKPIPYWLYKLHGLNRTFTCEICGNATYKGPKIFERHFADSRHAHGMACLGIPNTAHFANITKIQDAIALWEKLKSEKKMSLAEEEYEDMHGNVMNKKTYEDLKRQGLL